MTATDNLKDALSAGTALASPREVRVGDNPADLLAAVVPDGYRLDVWDVKRSLSGYQAAPDRTRGTVQLDDVASWGAYWEKHRTASSEAFADIEAGTVTAVINSPQPDAPAWADHKAVLKLAPTAQWQAWRGGDGKLFGQEAFAELLEANAADITDPDAATMIEVAQSIQQATSVQFESGFRLVDGQRRYSYTETTEAKAGKRGDLAVPAEFVVTVQVWAGVPVAVPLVARLRTRVSGGALQLGYVLTRPDEALRTAWDHLMAEVQGHVGDSVQVLAGRASYLP